MGIPSGLGAQLGIATESRYGTYAAPATFLEFTSESLRLAQNYVRTAGLRAGRLIQSENLHTTTTRTVSGDVQLDAMDQGLGKLLNLLHGNVVTPTRVTGGLYRQLHQVGTTAPTGKSLTVQVGRPAIDSTVHPFSYVGCKVVSATFTLARDGVVSVSFSIDGQDEDTRQVLGTATYAADAKPFNFIAAEVEFDDVLVADCVQQAVVTIPLALATDRFCIGAGALKKEPIPNALIAPTMALTMEFTSLAQQDAFVRSTRRKVELLCSGSNTSGTYGSALNFTAPSTVTTGEGPVVQGPDILTQEITMEIVDDGSGSPLDIEYISADAAL